MQQRTKNSLLIGGGIFATFLLLSSFSTISKKKEEAKPSGEESDPLPKLPTPPIVVPENKTPIGTDVSFKCPEGYVRVARGGVAGGIFYTCEQPKGKNLPKIKKIIE